MYTNEMVDTRSHSYTPDLIRMSTFLFVCPRSHSYAYALVRVYTIPFVCIYNLIRTHPISFVCLHSHLYTPDLIRAHPIVYNRVRRPEISFVLYPQPGQEAPPRQDCPTPTAHEIEVAADVPTLLVDDPVGHADAGSLSSAEGVRL